MPQIIHVINPVKVPESSDLFVAQPVTFEAMRVARAFAEPDVSVRLVSVQYAEDREFAPQDFELADDLDVSVLDFVKVESGRPKKLPRIADILARALEGAPDDAIVIYTNVDIAVQPYFYRSVAAMFDEGHDAVVINRRTITDAYRTVDDLPSMWSQIGEDHPGHDCFAMRASLARELELGDVVIGANWIGRAVILNLAYRAQRFTEHLRASLTFHIGDDQVWRGAQHDPYTDHNLREVDRVVASLVERFGPIADHPVARDYPWPLDMRLGFAARCRRRARWAIRRAYGWVDRKLA